MKLKICCEIFVALSKIDRRPTLIDTRKAKERFFIGVWYWGSPQGEMLISGQIKGFKIWPENTLSSTKGRRD